MALGERMKAFWGPRVPRREREGSRKSASQRRGSKSSKKQFRHVSILESFWFSQIAFYTCFSVIMMIFYTM